MTAKTALRIYIFNNEGHLSYGTEMWDLNNR